MRIRIQSLVRLGKAGRLLLTLVCCGGAQAAFAVPFDLVVPSHATITVGASGSTTNFAGWGWVTPVSGTLSDADLRAAVVSVSYSNPDVVVASTVSAVGSYSLAPGSFAGFDANFPNTNNQIFHTLLGPSETLGPRFDYRFSFTTPTVGYEGTGILTASLQIGNQVAHWSSQVDLDLSSRPFQGVTAQRITSVPEPGSGTLALLGLSGLALQGRRVAA